MNIQHPLVSNKTTRGFSLLEVLIALFILSIGLLGIAVLQTMGIRFNSQSLQRTQATYLAYDIIDRMRANRVEQLAGTYSNVDTSPSAPGSSKNYPSPATNCIGNPCTTAQLAAFDLDQWEDNVERLLTGGVGLITPDAAIANRYSVIVRWVENDDDFSLTIVVDV